MEELEYLRDGLYSDHDIAEYQKQLKHQAFYLAKLISGKCEKYDIDSEDFEKGHHKDNSPKWGTILSEAKAYEAQLSVIHSAIQVFDMVIKERKEKREKRMR